MEQVMAQTATNLPVNKTAPSSSKSVPAHVGPFDSLRKQMERLFDQFDRDIWHVPSLPKFKFEPLWGGAAGWGNLPAVDIVEKDKAYEISAELPGLDEKDIEVTLASGTLTIKGEKKEEKEEKKNDYYLSERHYGSFIRSFGVPEGVNVDKIEANFNKGVLTVTLPKTAEAQKPEKKIAIKAA
jgi:HSP20 family protein